MVKNLPAVQESQDMRVPSLGREDPLEEGMTPTPVFLTRESHDWQAIVHKVAKR